VPRQCWIFGASKTTNGHVWPKWLRRLTANQFGIYRIGIAGRPADWRVHKAAAFSHTARILCVDCNDRLGELESKVSLILPALVGGKHRRLMENEQRSLAQWFYKTGLMVSAAIDDPAAQLPRTHYPDLDRSLDLPPASAVWLGYLDDSANEAAAVFRGSSGAIGSYLMRQPVKAISSQ